MKNEQLASRTSTDGLTLAEVKDLGQVFVQSGFFRDCKESAQAIVKILYGKELGFSPVTSIMSIHIVEGKPELSSNLLATLVKQSDRYDYGVRRWTDEECVLVFTENGKELGESHFTIEDAQRAGLAKPGSGWSKYPRAMLFARAMSQGVRAYCPDVAMGVPIYAEGEISGKEPTAQENSEKPRTQEFVVVTRDDLKAATKAEETPKDDPEPESIEYIDLTRQRSLHGLAKSLMRDIAVGGVKMDDRQAELALRDFLEVEGYKDDKGRGTTKLIPVDKFLDIENKLREHVAAMKDMAASLESK